MVLIKSAFIFALLAPFALGKNSPCKEPKEKDKVRSSLFSLFLILAARDKHSLTPQTDLL